MSKIAVSPNGSGTGTYTLASPNNNASHTITLPVATGELLVNTSTGVSITGDLSFGDSDKIVMGASSDLEIYHDGSNSHIADVGSGDLNISGGNDLRLRTPDGENGLVLNQNGSIQLFYDDVIKLATTSSGISVTGTVAATSYTGASYTGNGSSLTSLTSANLTGALPAIDGSALTGVVGSTTAGAVGTYVFARGALSTSSRQFVWNSTYSGSGLYPAGPSAFVGATGSGSTWNTSGYGMAAGYYLASALTGTWRCLGHTHPTYDNPVTLFVRIS